MSYSWSEIRESVRLEDVLADLGIDVVPANVKGWQDTRCPLPTHHGLDASPSFGVNEDSLSFKCYSCDESGNLVRLVELMRECSANEALEYLAEFSDVDLEDEESMLKQIERWFDEPDKTKSRAIVLPWFHPAALDEYKLAPIELLEKWGIKHWTTAKVFGIRYDENHTRGPYTGRALLIPHYVNGTLVGWQERWLDDRPDWLGKYTNTNDFPKQDTLYNYERACAIGGDVAVVESAATVWRLFELGYAAVATFGKSITAGQRRLLRALPGVILALDADAGKQTQDMVEALEDDVSVRSLPPLEGENTDLADLTDQAIIDLMSG